MEAYDRYPHYITDKQLFYRCPYLDIAVGADQPPDVSEFIQGMGVGTDQAAEALHIALG